MSKPSKRMIYVLDDDDSFIKLMEFVMTKLGLKTELFKSPEKFLEKIKAQPPTLCFIDLNLGYSGDGFRVIQDIRAFNSALPLFVVSSDSTGESVSHALEIGANDYLIKPLNRKVLTSKLSNYLESPELEDLQVKHIQANKSAMELTVLLDAKIKHIDETGITVLTRHMIPKGTVLNLSGEMIEQILGKGNYLLATAISNSVQTEGEFDAYLEFDSTQKTVSNTVRNWIIAKRKTIGL